MSSVRKKRKHLKATAVAVGAWASMSVIALADGGVVFNELEDDALATYGRVDSTSVALLREIQIGSFTTPVGPADFISGPMMVSGLPGVAVFDFDRDGDLDIYATNGPGGSNPLLSNQLMETGSVSFVDVAATAGVDATDQDSFGTCFGDTDNDGDDDLLVLGRNEPNRFFVNNGDGTFSQFDAGLGGGDLSSTACTVADFDNDGLLDIVVGNSFDMDSSEAIFVEPYDDNQHNQLFMNEGGNHFTDRSEASGITNNGGNYEGRAGITWAVASADVDRDGDIDVIFADDQGNVLSTRIDCSTLPPGYPFACGIDRAYTHVFLNDGDGNFVDRPLIEDSPDASSEWIGVEVGDLNCDGNQDLFVSNFGDYDNPAIGAPYVLGGSASRWFLGNGDGTFTDPGVGDLVATPFGWGAAIFDYDNDGDNDILFHGGLQAGNNLVDNPGTLLTNQDCSANFTADLDAISVDHVTRNVRGVAYGDLDRNGFPDVVTVANWRNPAEVPIVPTGVAYGGPFDEFARIGAAYFLVNDPSEFPPQLVWGGIPNDPGDLKVELNSGDNGNGSINISALGSIGLTRRGRVNRSGIGATITVTPRRGRPLVQAVVGGSSHSSQHALERTFGYGTARRGTVEIDWPGNVSNRLYGARRGERLTLPELPCSYDEDWDNVIEYSACVVPALADLRRAGAIDRRTARRLLVSALIAYYDR